jgi:hypothetical protein
MDNGSSIRKKGGRWWVPIVNLLADVLMVCSHDPCLIYHWESVPLPSPIPTEGREELQGFKF